MIGIVAVLLFVVAVFVGMTWLMDAPSCSEFSTVAHGSGFSSGSTPSGMG